MRTILLVFTQKSNKPDIWLIKGSLSSVYAATL